jgi:hypothetical protein
MAVDMLNILSDPVDGAHRSSSSRYSCSACPWPSTCDILRLVLHSRANGLSTPRDRPCPDDIGHKDLSLRRGLRDLVISLLALETPHSRAVSYGKGCIRFPVERRKIRNNVLVGTVKDETVCMIGS